MRQWQLMQMDEVIPVPCPCGQSRRAFVSPDNKAATLHMVDIAADSRAHYHRRLTEIYFILEGSGHLELDGELIPVKPMTAVLIKPGCRHRAVGRLRIINIPVPAFDPNDPDEWFD
jgi:mannose-6-phosphate isomerase-like protein (cupin superfamily)